MDGREGGQEAPEAAEGRAAEEAAARLRGVCQRGQRRAQARLARALVGGAPEAGVCAVARPSPRGAAALQRGGRRRAQEVGGRDEGVQAQRRLPQRRRRDGRAGGEAGAPEPQGRARGPHAAAAGGRPPALLRRGGRGRHDPGEERQVQGAAAGGAPALRGGGGGAPRGLQRAQGRVPGQQGRPALHQEGGGDQAEGLGARGQAEVPRRGSAEAAWCPGPLCAQEAGGAGAERGAPLGRCPQCSHLQALGRALRGREAPLRGGGRTAAARVPEGHAGVPREQHLPELQGRGGRGCEEGGRKGQSQGQDTAGGQEKSWRCGQQVRRPVERFIGRPTRVYADKATQCLRALLQGAAGCRQDSFACGLRCFARG
mmetsp:Transcript_25736/g.81252  ORF Transcript_25736/g.81252 Transcript_25736/m.81252 type:complete len:371 (+) Transcript_25736:472-1584(+)